MCIQALSGTGALRVGAAFIGKFMPGTKVGLTARLSPRAWAGFRARQTRKSQPQTERYRPLPRPAAHGAQVFISNPTWGNHMNIFGDERVEWAKYR